MTCGTYRTADETEWKRFFKQHNISLQNYVKGSQRLEKEQEEAVLKLVKERFLQHKEEFKHVITTTAQDHVSYQENNSVPADDEVVLEVVSRQKSKSGEFHDVDDDYFPENVSIEVPLLPEYGDPTPASSTSLL